MRLDVIVLRPAVLLQNHVLCIMFLFGREWSCSDLMIYTRECACSGSYLAVSMHGSINGSFLLFRLCGCYRPSEVLKPCHQFHGFTSWRSFGMMTKVRRWCTRSVCLPARCPLSVRNGLDTCEQDRWATLSSRKSVSNTFCGMESWVDPALSLTAKSLYSDILEDGRGIPRIKVQDSLKKEIEIELCRRCCVFNPIPLLSCDASLQKFSDPRRALCHVRLHQPYLHRREHRSLRPCHPKAE